MSKPYWMVAIIKTNKNGGYVLKDSSDFGLMLSDDALD